MRAMGWAHEGEAPGSWDRSCLGYDEAWENETQTPGYHSSSLARNTTINANSSGKHRARAGTETEETYLHSNAASTVVSPRVGSSSGWYQSSTPERVRSPPPAVVAAADTRVSFGSPRQGDEDAVTVPKRERDDIVDDNVGDYMPEGVDYEELRRRRIEEENERELMA